MSTKNDPPIAGANGTWEQCNQHGWPSSAGKRHQIKVGPFIVMELPRPRCTTYELRPSGEFEPHICNYMFTFPTTTTRRDALAMLRERLQAGIDAIDKELKSGQ